MFFTKSATVAAVNMCILGAWLIFSGFYFGGDEAAMKRYVGGQNPGHYIDRGLELFLYAIALGTIGEISRSVSLHRAQENAEAKS